MLQVLGHESEAALLRQSSIGVSMHGCARTGLMSRTSTRSGLTPLVTEQPAQTETIIDCLTESPLVGRLIDTVN